jgi:hypothetical protein
MFNRVGYQKHIKSRDTFSKAATMTKDKVYEDWEKLIAHCDTLDGLTKNEREAAKDAFRFLKAELGDRFLIEASKEKHYFIDVPHDKSILFSGTKYSYIGTITNGAPWTRKWMTWLAHALKKIKYQNNYLSLLERIKDKNRYIEALSVLDVAHKLASVGFTVSIDPEIDVRGKTRKPDIRLTDKYSRDIFYVEVSTKSVDEGTIRSMQTMSAFADLFMPNYPSIQFSGIIHRNLAKKHLDEIIEKTKRAIEKCINEKSFQELLEENIIELGMTISESNSDFKAWCSKRGLKPGQLNTPNTETNQINRIIALIGEKQNQVPKECPNIIVVRNDYLFPKHTPKNLISILEEEIFRYEHVLMTIVCGVNVLSDNAVEEYGHHLYIRQRYFDIVNYEFLILFNRFCKFNVSKVTTAKIFHAFKKY